MRSWVIGATAIATLVASRVAAQDTGRLPALLRAVEEESRVTALVRADGELTVASPEETHRFPAILIYRPGTVGTDLYVELGNDGGKALILNDGTQAFRLAKGATQAQPFPADATLADSEFAREDLQPLRIANFADTRISDEGAGRMTVSIAPKASPYCLLVVTFDTERNIPLKVMYYQQTPNNLVKMQRNSDQVLVGRKWLPTTVTMEDFKMRTMSTLTLKWSQPPSVSPERFDPALLAKTVGGR
ncbi:MAG: outer membrane lipoprotein-sorting protein [Deltaproteobacteria bacterium]|nr:outer membrane lipoprotein-sorting protein [Deltaproteobacteria bacterium]MBI3389349.1 outer membrane lipoprotein-sorting protein [Deltaproteobacteria bacterium]